MHLLQEKLSKENLSYLPKVIEIDGDEVHLSSVRSLLAKVLQQPALIFILFLFLTSLYHQVQSAIKTDQITLSIKCC